MANCHIITLAKSTTQRLNHLTIQRLNYLTIQPEPLHNFLLYPIKKARLNLIQIAPRFATMEKIKEAFTDDETARQEVYRLTKYTKILTCLILLLIGTCIYILHGRTVQVPIVGPNSEKTAAGVYLSHVSEAVIRPFDNSKEGELAAYGHRLITETYKYLGPEVKEGMVTGNNLACSSCHLNGGTKAYAAPYIGLSGVFPIYIGRENKVESLEERINGCFERSMNGKAIPVNSKEMRAMISYIKHLSRDVAIGKRIEGQGFVQLNKPNRAADRIKGAAVFKRYCITCHGENGQGNRRGQSGDGKGYLYPPLWGNDSFNDGAGMARLLTAARFIKGNMPLGATAENPILTDEEAYDVAAYINSFSRPQKANKELDYPDLTKKPKDCPYPPYIDQVTITQHKLGPFNF